MADTIIDLIKASADFLSRKNISNPRLEAEILLADLLGCERIHLYARFDRALDEDQKNNYRQRIVERGKNKPSAYILGKKHFHKYEFAVNENVLIPRPETEELVDFVLKSDLPEDAKILDLCCGTGCIGITLLLERPGYHVDFSDLSLPALEICRRNAASLGVTERSSFFQGNLFENILNEKYDAICTNPPYIRPEEKDSLSSDVLFEPESALFHPDPVSLYREIFQGALSRLKSDGFFIGELSPFCAEGVLEAGKSLFATAFLIKDLSGKNRFFAGKGL